MSDENRRRLALNPFSLTAVAKVSDSTGMVTVETPSIREAVRYLDEYLAPAVFDEAGHKRRPGFVIALQGDYGSGKTHLGALLLNRVQERSGVGEPREARPVYLDAVDTFRDLYLRFITGLPRHEVHARVREYYAEIVEDRLDDVQISERVGSLIREQKADLERLTTTLGLSESSLVVALRHELEAVTKSSAFAAVLSLLVRPGFEEPAWDWLLGGEPHPLLRERGIDEPIGEATALDALGVFARLYGGVGHPFIVVIDELNRLIRDPESMTDATLGALQKLLESFDSAGTMLVLIGLTESFELLGSGVRQRIGSVITMSPFDVPATRRFIELSLARMGAGGPGGLHPFSADAVREIVDLAYGNPRKIGLYCRRLYGMLRPDDERRQITAGDVRVMAREHFGADKRPRVAIAVQAVIENQLLDYFRDYYVSADRRSRVDYWVVVPGTDAGCALFLTGAVTEPGDVDELTERVAFVRDAATCEALLVVSEALAPEHRAALTDAFGREPLVYHRESFPDDLASLLKAMKYRLDQSSGGDALVVLRDRVDRIGGQQSRLQSVLEQLVVGLRDFRSASEHGLDGVRRELGDLSRTVATVARRPGGGRDGDPDSALPGEVSALFDERLGALDELETVAPLMDGLFRQQNGTDPSAFQDALATIRAAMSRAGRPAGDPAVTPALGVSTLLRQLITAFRRAVDDWFRSSPVPRRRLQAAETDELDLLCETYDAVFEYLPTFELEGLVRLAPDADRLALSERLREIRRELESLAVDTRHTVLSQFPL